MDHTALFTQLKTTFPTLKVEKDFVMAPLTTLKIGGPADIYIEIKTNAELVEVLKYLNEKGVRSEATSSSAGSNPQKLIQDDLHITMLGNGSNILISDTGIRGIVIRNLSKEIKILGDAPTIAKTPISLAKRTENEPQKYLDFASLDYDESTEPRVQVSLDAGVPLPYAINYLISQGVTGLQWFAYIPGSIGGATWYNIHGGKYNLSTYIDSVEVFDLNTGKVSSINNSLTKGVRSEATSSEVGSTAKNASEPASFAYELSPFQSHPQWIILSTTLNLYRGDAARAKAVTAAWIAQKAKVQPMNSAGSVFQNPSLEDSVRLWGEQKSAGWIIDHELGWKGKSIGDAQISEKHANFIVNTGHAIAADYYTLARMVQNEVQSRFKLDLKMEVKLLGDFAAPLTA